MPGERRGQLLLEMLVALTLGVVVLASLAAVVTAAIRWNQLLIARGEGLEVGRTVWLVLREELGSERMDRDWTLDDDGVLSLRAFRGFGRVCAAEDDGWIVAYRGRREPDIGKDSLLVLGTDGRWRPYALGSVESRAAAAGCELDGRDVALRISWGAAGEPGPLVVRVFERGSYHLADRAFRYRSGAGGRQPLTSERVAGSSRFDVEGRGLRVTLDLTSVRDRTAPTRLTWTVAEALR